MSDTTVATGSQQRIDPVEIELVGPSQKQRGVQLPQLLVCPLCNLLVRLTMDDILHPCEKPAWSIECYDPGLGMRHSILNDDGFVSLCETQ